MNMTSLGHDKRRGDVALGELWKHDEAGGLYGMPMPCMGVGKEHTQHPPSRARTRTRGAHTRELPVLFGFGQNIPAPGLSPLQKGTIATLPACLRYTAHVSSHLRRDRSPWEKCFGVQLIYIKKKLATTSTTPHKVLHTCYTYSAMVVS